MPEPMIGEIRMFTGDYAPKGWALCDGGVLEVNRYPALFSVLQNRFGGDGRRNFALPDLRGRVPLHRGAGEGLKERQLGVPGGSAGVALTTAQMPPHKHEPRPKVGGATSQSPIDGVWAQRVSMYREGRPTVAMPAAAIGTTGGGTAHENMQPHLVVNFIIAVDGTFPMRG